MFKCLNRCQNCAELHVAGLYYKRIMSLAYVVYLTIRQRGKVAYELIVNEGAARVDYLFRYNEAELSNCFSIHSYPKYKL